MFHSALQRRCSIRTLDQLASRRLPEFGAIVLFGAVPRCRFLQTFRPRFTQRVNARTGTDFDPAHDLRNIG
jgi:hypothetical protein